MEFSWGSVKLYDVNDIGYSIGDSVYFLDDSYMIGSSIEFGKLGDYGLADDYRGTNIRGTHLGADERFLKNPYDRPEDQYYTFSSDYMLTLGYEDREVEIFNRNIESWLSDEGYLVIDGDLRLLFSLWKACLEYRNYERGDASLLLSWIAFIHFGETGDSIDLWIPYIKDTYEKMSELYGAEKFESMLDEVDAFLMTEHGYDSRLFE